jgi:hypothetical protein
MTKQQPAAMPGEYAALSPWRAFVRAWEHFWFKPADPTPLAVIRICTGLLAVYTLVVYSFDLQEFFGVNAWLDYDSRLAVVREAPEFATPLSWGVTVMQREPRTEEEQRYAKEYKAAWGTWPSLPSPPPEQQAYALEYKKQWGVWPPEPYPRDAHEAAEYDRLRKEWGFDPRAAKLPLPTTAWQEAYVKDYLSRWGGPPPPPYPRDEGQARAFDRYRQRWGADPRVVYARGTPVWSLWFHITDPTAMAVVHGLIIAVFVLFTVGFCTRLTSVLAWAGMITYIHRTPTVLFGVDTMMNIVLIYLMIGPSGAALSVDCLFRRWWASARPRVIGRWRALLGRPAAELEPAADPPAPAPLASANFAIRLLQIHVCIIYLIAGIAKLQGAAWWKGDAVWGTLANYEFAPMQFGLYTDGLRSLSRNRVLIEIFLTSATYFTLFFEICYVFLIWLRRTRWLMLGMAIVLHGVIGTFMGLKTFSLMMLIMNMAFLTPAEVNWLLRPVRWCWRALTGPAATPPALAPAGRSTAILAAKEPTPVASGHVRRKM